MVELAKALTLEEQAEGHLVILLDEPTSVLEQADIDILFARVRALKARASFVFVSHRLDEVLALSDRVYVMKDGQVVAELAAADADVHQLHQLMVGRGRQSEYYRESAQQPYRDEGAAGRRRARPAPAHYQDVDFALHAGEILGIAGVIGSGPRGALPHAVRLRAADRRAHPGRRRSRCASPRPPTRSTRHRLRPARAPHRGPGAVPVRSPPT